MKTFREQLLARHRHAEPQLDALRARVLKDLSTAEPATATTWARLIDCFRLPRVAWAGVAAAWAVIIVLNLAASEPTRPTARAEATNRGTATAAWRERPRLYAELLDTSLPKDVEAPRPAPRPRSDRQTTIAFA